MRTSPATGPLRIARSGLLVVIAFALASLAHTAAGGRLPSLLLLVPLVVPVACIAYLITARLVGFRTTALLMSGLQLVLHELFSVLGGYGQSASTFLPGAASAPRASRAVDIAASASGSPHAHLHTTSGGWPNLPLPTLEGDVLAPHPGLGSAAAVAMLVLHLLATILTVLALTATERAVWQVWAWLRPLFVLLAQLVPFPTHRRVSIVEFALSEPVLRRAGRRRRRRGPPSRKSSSALA